MKRSSSCPLFTSHPPKIPRRQCGGEEDIYRKKEEEHEDYHPSMTTPAETRRNMSTDTREEDVEPLPSMLVTISEDGEHEDDDDKTEEHSYVDARIQSPPPKHVTAPGSWQLGGTIDISKFYSYRVVQKSDWKSAVNRQRVVMEFDRDMMDRVAMDNHEIHGLAIIDLASQLSRGMPSNVFMGVEINHHNFDKPFCLHLRPIRGYQPDFLERELDYKMQSARNVDYDNGELEITLTFATPPRGSGKENAFIPEGEAAPVIEDKKWMQKVATNNVTSHCLLTAVLQGIAHINVKLAKIAAAEGRPADVDEMIRIRRRWFDLKDGDATANRRECWAEVEALKNDSGVDKVRNYDMEDVRRLQEYYRDEYQLIVFNEKYDVTPLFRGEFVDDDHVIPLLLVDEHFLLIKTLAKFMYKDSFCSLCMKGNSAANRHYKCPLKCSRCLVQGCHGVTGEENIGCPTCTVTFGTRECYDNHLNPGPNGGRSRCENTGVCDDCKEVYYKDRNQEHKCGMKFCRTCFEPRLPGHSHTLAVSKKKKEFHEKRIIFDIETMVVKDGNGNEIHRAVLALALRCCERCRDTSARTYEEACLLTCDNCSPDGHRFKEFSCVDPGTENIDIMVPFAVWLYAAHHKDFTIIAHNLKGFDGQLILQQVLTPAVPPPKKLAMAGLKLNYMELCGTRTIDSFNFVPFGLAKFSKAFGVEEFAKGDFPFKFIQPENFGYEGPLPHRDFYDYGSRCTEGKVKLDSWYMELEADPTYVFNFRTELKRYCYADVALLAESMRKFEEDMFKRTQVMVFEECVTAASAAMKVFRRGFLEPDTIVLDADASSTRVKQSTIARRYLAYREAKVERCYIRSANNDGEMQIAGYYVDGYVEPCEAYPNGKVIEFNGCYHHRHNCKLAPMAPADDGLRAHEIWKRDKKKKEALEMICPVEIVWECEVLDEAETNPELKRSLEKNVRSGPVDAREALYGGRTEVIRLFLDLKDHPGKKIHYLDFTSLYPYVMKYCEYPKGESEEIKGKSIPRNLYPIRDPAALRRICHGHMSCKVRPPSSLFLPVLPYRGEKLLFALCQTCADLMAKKEPVPNPCPHTDKERCLYGNWTTVELELALEKGYEIVEVFGGHHWPEEKWVKFLKNGDEISHGIFSKFINEFLKAKQEASGFGPGIVTDAQKAAFIDEYFEKEGVRLELDKIGLDEVGRQIAKLLLNSLWGKFGEKVDRVETTIITSPSELFNILMNPAKEVVSLQIHNNHAISIQTRTSSGALTPLSTSSLPYAILTTAHARCHLYRVLDEIPDMEQNLAYMDTDSMVFLADAAANPLQRFCGDFLGELTNEVPHGWHIEEFYTVGAKSYCYTEVKDDDPTRTKLKRKAKGFAKNADMEQLLTKDLMRDQIMRTLECVRAREANPDVDPAALSAPPTATVTYNTIVRNRDHQLVNKTTKKVFKFTFDKRHILADGGTLPIGYR